ncbi:hypothetical protein [Bacillus badius]|uniref:hypothetical protein n=1 Tax=Bacillus badius TaxID=1455 RepID=UPI00059742AF|nr:hypothetical protein [Bacillus badius]MED4715379.1 hypothetical protein [Bacillus badius]UAT31922.1 hypothetical protein K7T73_06785 [Bacillus badius]
MIDILLNIMVLPIIVVIAIVFIALILKEIFLYFFNKSNEWRREKRISENRGRSIYRPKEKKETQQVPVYKNWAVWLFVLLGLLWILGTFD